MEPKEIVRALREDLQLNRREFCDYFNIPYRTVQDWECGKRVMPEYVLSLLEYKIRMDQMLQEQSETKKVVVGQGFCIRSMQLDDYEDVHQLWSSCDGIGLNEVDDSKKGIEKFLVRNPKTCFVAEQEGKIVGTILAGCDGRRAYLYHLAVLEEYRGKGIGKELVVTATEAIERLGIQKTALVVFSENEEANKFWEKMGFIIREDLTYRNKAFSE